MCCLQSRFSSVSSFQQGCSPCLKLGKFRIASKCCFKASTLQASTKAVKKVLAIAWERYCRVYSLLLALTRCALTFVTCRVNVAPYADNSRGRRLSSRIKTLLAHTFGTLKDDIPCWLYLEHPSLRISADVLASCAFPGFSVCVSTAVSSVSSCVHFSIN